MRRNEDFIVKKLNVLIEKNRIGDDGDQLHSLLELFGVKTTLDLLIYYKNTLWKT